MDFQVWWSAGFIMSELEFVVVREDIMLIPAPRSPRVSFWERRIRLRFILRNRGWKSGLSFKISYQTHYLIVLLSSPLSHSHTTSSYREFRSCSFINRSISSAVSSRIWGSQLASSPSLILRNGRLNSNGNVASSKLSLAVATCSRIWCAIWPIKCPPTPKSAQSWRAKSSGVGGWRENKGHSNWSVKLSDPILKSTWRERDDSVVKDNDWWVLMVVKNKSQP